MSVCYVTRRQTPFTSSQRKSKPNWKASQVCLLWGDLIVPGRWLLQDRTLTTKTPRSANARNVITSCTSCCDSSIMMLSGEPEKPLLGLLRGVHTLYVFGTPLTFCFSRKLRCVASSLSRRRQRNGRPAGPPGD